MIVIGDDIRQLCPDLQLGLLHCEVTVEPSSEQLLTYIDEQLSQIQHSLTTQQISQLPVAQFTRRGYKATGKDPARYRPSAEALLRRVVQGKGLYRINNVVDCLNLVSVKTAFSIGGYDIDKTSGNIVLGIGQPSETLSGHRQRSTQHRPPAVAARRSGSIRQPYQRFGQNGCQRRHPAFPNGVF